MPGTASPEVVSSSYALEVLDVSKQFPGVKALDRITLRLRAGAVHALMGENGAGKSTLMKIIAGSLRPTSGEIRVRGVAREFHGPADAMKCGIAMIHQELNLVPHMTVAENIWIGREPRRFGFVDHGAMRRRTAELLGSLGIALDPDDEVASLAVANRQMVEIAKAVSHVPDILIMDEPTSSLTEHEALHLFGIIRRLRGQGRAIVYISHKMNEIFAIADEISVFRDGLHVSTGPATRFDQKSLIGLMVGRELTHLFPKAEVAPGVVVLSARGLTLPGVFRDISFDLRRGEILGLAGLIGAGRTNVAEALYGVVPAASGSIEVDGRPARIRNARDAIACGMAFLTEDRKASGLFMMLSVLENMQIASVSDYSRGGFVRQDALSSAAEAMRTALRVKTPDMDTTIETLSGGNQQKVLIARWLMTGPRILILDEPTRGIDVGAKSEIHRLMSELVAGGLSIIMISSELPEILGMSDRILVMREGRPAGFLERHEATQERIMELAAR